MANIKKDFASPNGPILLLSAKGSTTSSIVEADGVKDFSGNENHGQAYGGLTIPTGEDEFSFDGTDDYINIAGSKFSSINGVEGVTLFCRFKCSSSIADGTKNLVTISLNGSSIGLAMRIAVADGVVNLSYGGRSHDTGQSAKMNSPSAALNKEQWYSCAVVASTANHICTAYIDGDTFASITTWHTDPFVTPNSVKIGSQSGSNNFFNGSISDVHIYPRALSADEVKYLHGGFQPSLSIGQKYPIKVMYGSREAERIYYGSNLIYINVSDYSDRPPVGTIKQITTTVAAASQYQNGSALVLRNGNVKGIVCTDYVNSKVMFFLPNGTRSPGTFTDYSHTNLVNPYYLCEDDEGYVYTTGGNSGYLFKLQPVVSGSTYSFNLVASLKLGSMVAANEVTYNAARSSLIVIGWDSGGGTSHCYQVPKTLASATSIARWSMPSLGGCMTLDGTKLFVGLYNSSAGSGIFTFSSASDITEKTSRTTTIYPNSYSPKISGSSDSRFWIAANDGYMYWNMLNGTLYKYDTNGAYVSTITTSVDSPRQDGSIVYDDKDNALTFIRTDGYAYKIYL